ncbi:MAG: hypothetical protein QNJ84_11860 [Alphaproteobacteria bacterium]|nr:hypothetical protein [Alphaproteobacteria bacterium]
MIGSQAAYAEHAGISRQAVNKAVKQRKIPVRPDGQIDFEEADHARRQNGDPARRMAAMAGEPEPPDHEDENLALDEAAPKTGGLSFNKARTVREAYQAKMAELEYERQLGLWLRKQEVQDAMVASGRKIRQGLDGVVGWAEELDAAARNGGIEAVRTVLKERVRTLETMIVESLNLLADDDT